MGTDLCFAHFNAKTRFGEGVFKALIDEHTKFDSPILREHYFPDFDKEKEAGAEDKK